MTKEFLQQRLTEIKQEFNDAKDKLVQYETEVKNTSDLLAMLRGKYAEVQHIIDTWIDEVKEDIKTVESKITKKG